MSGQLSTTFETGSIELESDQQVFRSRSLSGKIPLIIQRKYNAVPPQTIGTPPLPLMSSAAANDASRNREELNWEQSFRMFTR